MTGFIDNDAAACTIRKILPFILFIIIAFGYSWTLWIVMWVFFGKHIAAFKIAAMFGPALGCIVVRQWISREGFKDAGAGLGLKRMYPIAWLASPLLAGLGVVVISALGLATWGWNPQPELSATNLIRAPGGFSDAPTVLLQLLFNLTVNTAIAFPIVLGEDLGWAGYAIPKLVPRWGRARTAWLFGLMWASWHLPVHIMGHNNPDRSLVGLVGASILIAAIGVFYAWLRIVSGSLWVPTLFHASMDVAGTSPFLLVRSEAADVWGIAELVTYLFLAVFVTIHLARAGPSGVRAGES